MKLFYLNDEKQDVIVKVMDQTWDYTYNSSNAKNLCTLKPAEGRMFDLVIPDGAILWIKKWSAVVMLSYVESSALPESDEQLPRSGAV
jgi:hypothetical protein